MRLNLDELQRVVRKTLDEERAVEALKGEISRVLGPVVVTEGRKLEEVAAAANDWLDVLERTGRSNRLDFLSNVSTAFLDHRDPEVRKFAARIVPERFLGKLTTDRDSAVRAAVASRVPLPAVIEMMKKFRNDDQLRTIYRRRKLHEGGISKPKVEPMGTDVSLDAEPLGDTVKQHPGSELSEAWYEQQANRFLHDYGQNIEYAWEELATHRFCSSVKATSGVEIDETKLLKSIKSLIKEKEDLAMERNALRETLAYLDKQAAAEKLDESVLPELDLIDDPVRKMVESGKSGEEYLTEMSLMFRIQEAMLPSALRKYRLGEGNARVTTMPIIGYLPHGGNFRSIDERALDKFCESWNKRQALAGEPIRLKWSTHPENVSKVSFSCQLS